MKINKILQKNKSFVFEIDIYHQDIFFVYGDLEVAVEKLRPNILPDLQEQFDSTIKEIQSIENIETYIEELLQTIQKDIYQKARDYRDTHITKVDTYEEFKKVLEEKGGFISAHWDGTEEEEEQIKAETKATIRCIPLDAEEENGISLISGKPSKRRVMFAKAY